MQVDSFFGILNHSHGSSSSSVLQKFKTSESGALLIDSNTQGSISRHFGFLDRNPVSGVIIRIFREGTGHISADGRIFLVTYDNNGVFGSEVEQTSLYIAAGNVELRNLSGGYDKYGRLHLIYSEYDGGASPNFRRVLYSYSDNNGSTWSTPSVLMTSDSTYYVWNTYGRIVEFDDGEIWIPFNVRNQNATIYYKQGYWKSTNRGTTWTLVYFDDTNTTYAGEGYMVKLTNNIVLCLTRLTLTSGGYRQYVTTDKGVTWTNHGATVFETFGNTSTTNQPCSIRTFDLNGEMYLECFYISRISSGSVRWVYGKARDLIAGSAFWRPDTINFATSSYTGGLAHGYGNMLDNNKIFSFGYQYTQPDANQTFTRHFFTGALSTGKPSPYLQAIVTQQLRYLSGTPAANSITPDFIGQFYFNTSTSKLYVGFGVAGPGDWYQITP